MAREWEHPKRDLLDLERTYQAERVQELEAALRAILNGQLCGNVDLDAPRFVEARRLLADDATAWTPEQILTNEA